MEPEFLFPFSILKKKSMFLDNDIYKHLQGDSIFF